MWLLVPLLFAVSGCSLIVSPGENDCAPECVSEGVVRVDHSVSEASTGAATTVTASFEVSGPDQLLLVALATHSDAYAFESVTYGSAPLSPLHGAFSDELRLELWYLLNPSPGEDKLSAMFGAERALLMGALTLSGVDLEDPFGASAHLEGVGDNISMALPAAPGQLVLTLVAQYSRGGLAELSFEPESVELFRTEHLIQPVRLVGETLAGEGQLYPSVTTTGMPSLAGYAMAFRPRP